MEKLRLRKIAMGAVVLCSFSAGMLIDAQHFAPTASYAKVSSDEFDIKGTVKGLTRKAKMITLDQKDKGFFFIKFDDKTIFKNLKDITQLKVGEKVRVHYKKIATDNVALKIEKLLIKLPEGVTEIKTAELKELMDNKKTFVLVDARPSPKYEQNHIPGAVSVPYGKVKKVGDDSEKGMKLLPYDKDTLLVFYCGGDT